MKQHEPGAKLDQDKPDVNLVLGNFAKALMEVSKVGTEGAKKYSRNGWLEVPDGKNRYNSACERHYLKEQMGEEVDPDFGLLHAAHRAWNALAYLELVLREKDVPSERKEPKTVPLHLLKEDPIFLEGYLHGLKDKELEEKYKAEAEKYTAKAMGHIAKAEEYVTKHPFVNLVDEIEKGLVKEPSSPKIVKKYFKEMAVTDSGKIVEIKEEIPIIPSGKIYEEDTNIFKYKLNEWEKRLNDYRKLYLDYMILGINHKDQR